MTDNNHYSVDFFRCLMEDYDRVNDHSGINGERIANRLSELSKIGLTNDGGSNRMGFSAEERYAKDLVKKWMEEAGLQVHMDGAGNLFGRIISKDDTLPIVMSGSHVDSVPNGGHFDGPLGVLTALEVVEAWKETGYVPNKPFEVVVFSDEEGARFQGGFLGSAALIGENDKEKLISMNDVFGNSFQEVIEGNGLTLDGFFQKSRNIKDIAAFIEVHIEQGKRLEKENLPVGAVTGIAGPCWLEISFHGNAGHAGNTPMNDRNDALIAAGDFVSKLESLPEKVSSTAVATVGRFNVYPNGINVIPGKVTLTVDVRDITQHTRDQLVDDVVKLAQNVVNSRNIKLEMNEKLRVEPIPISEVMQRKISESIEKNNLSTYLLPSGAGHDAMILGRHIPVAMLFVRSKDGISHNPQEWTKLNDCVLAAHVLKNMIEDLTT